MKSLIKKNKLIRDLYKINELTNYINAALVKNNLLSPEFKKRQGLLAGLATLQNPNKTNKPSITKIRNICVITGRTRAVNLDYKMSRIKFKQNAEAGLIPGIKKL